MDLEKARTCQMITNPNHDPCTVCGMPMFANKCKIVCLHCGFKRDCSDY